MTPPAPAKFLLTPAALRDLEEVWDYIAAERPGAARKMVRRLLDAVETLAEFPMMGHPRDDLSDEILRVWPVDDYLIVYRPDEKPIEIIRILSGYRDLIALFPGDAGSRS